MLLILAAVSIATLTGENGILTKAGTAKTDTQKASAIEQAKIDILAWQTEKLGKGLDATITNEQIKTIITGKEYVKADEENNPGEESFISKEGHTILYSELYSVITPQTPEGNTAVVGEIVEESNATYTTEDGIAKIPVGFMIVPGCDDISEGLVISDNPGDAEEDASNIVAEGNQFVWIPVTNGNNYVRNTSYVDTDVSAAAYTDTGYLPEVIQPTIEASITDKQAIGLINEEAERDAVVSAGGFYVGRYEAGDSAASSYRSSSTDRTLVSKKNVYVYEYIAQEDTKTKAKTFKNSEYVKSALISGIQWDVIMATVNGKLDGDGKEYIVTEFGGVGRTWEEHLKTGQIPADKVYNIYDLEGNVREFVAEKTVWEGEVMNVARGRPANDYWTPACARWCDDGSAWVGTAFRLVLYVL